MSLIVKEEKGIVLIKFDGVITIYEVSEYVKILNEIFQEKKKFEMDLIDVHECDAAGIQLICSSLKQKSSENNISITGISEAVKYTAKSLGITFEKFFRAEEM